MFRDSHGMPLAVGEKLGEGGEGTVFVIDGSLAAKIYSRPITQTQLAKLHTMLSLCDEALRSVAAWPVGLVYLGRRPVGFTMPRLTSQFPLHELFGSKRRHVLFPDAHWKFLMHAAMNVARAFDVAHKRDIVIGDVNSNNVVLYRDSRAAFIDCDSFQVASGGTVFRCKVGVPEYQPPELQGKDLARCDRLPQHDLFGLAVIVFQLLFIGRHPFAGVVPRRMRDTASIGDNVAARRYFYGPEARRLGLQPPPGMPSLTAITPLMSSMFAEAFLGPASSRPSAARWVAALNELKGRTIVCRRVAGHHHLESTSCPWCALERRGLFYFAASTLPLACGDDSILESFTSRDVELIWSTIARVVPPPPIDPRILRERIHKPEKLDLWKLNRQAAYLAAAPILLAAVAALSLQEKPWFAASLAIVGIVVALLCRPDARSVMAGRRQRFSRTYRDYLNAADAWTRAAQNVAFVEAFERLSNLRQQLNDQHARLSADLKSLVTRRQQQEREAFLGLHRIAAHEIPGIDRRICALLRSNGIETAADLTEAKLKRAPKLGRQRKANLRIWRQKIESGFQFDAKKHLESRHVRELKERHARERISMRNELCQGATALRKVAFDIQRRRPLLRKLTVRRAALMWQAEADLRVSPIWYRM